MLAPFVVRDGDGRVARARENSAGAAAVVAS